MYIIESYAELLRLVLRPVPVALEYIVVEIKTRNSGGFKFVVQTSTQRCRAWRKNLTTFMKSVLKLQHQNREAFWTVLYPTEEIEMRRK
jgi:hypothetical protein